MLRKLLSIFLFIAVLVPTALAQTGSITGKVTDAETGESVPTANVLIVEIQRGSATDSDGNYTIRNIQAGTYTLRVSFVGYRTYTTKVNVQAGETITQNVQLQPGAVGLDELVVTGYGVETKRELTGSITKVSSDDFRDVPIQNTEQLLQGRAAGVSVTSTSGNAGSGFRVRVRGTGSINAGSDPLYIVDGVQISFSNRSEELDESPLNAINPNDIESIEVLKDAAAAAIYGAQAANGVVLITTKRGQKGDTRISVNIEQGVRSDIRSVDYMNRDQWIEFNLRAIQNTFPTASAAVVEDFWRNNNLPAYGFAADTPFNELPDTDWLDFIYRDGHSQSYNIAVSGGDDKTRFRISGTFENTEDQIDASRFKQFNLRSNLDHQINDKLSTVVNISLSNSDMLGPCQDGFFINCPVSGATFTSPITRPFLDDGSYSPFFPLVGASSNPAVTFNEVERRANTTQILGNISATYNFKSWLSLTGQVGLDWQSVHDNDTRSPLASSVGGSINESIANTTNLTLNTVLNFRQTFNDVHNVSGLVGTEYRRDFTRELESTGFGFPNQFFKVLDATAEPITASGFNTEFRIAGYFSNLKYNYDNKYFVSVSARYDGSSRFGEDNRWGFFPSGSIAWRVTEEDFFNPAFLEELKLRASYGVTGNSNIGNFAARGLFGVGGTYSGTTALSPTQLANPLLTWEEAKSLNLGLDYSIFDGRISGSVDVYQRDNEALLLNTPLPQDSGFGSITRNIGEVRNKGIEFEVRSINIDAGDFVWSTRFNIAIQSNEVRKLSEDIQALSPNGLQPIEIGRALNAWNVVHWAGVNPADGRPMWEDADGNITYNPTVQDRRPFDAGEADALGGFGNTIRYKGFSLDVFFQYSYGQTAQPQQVFFFGMAQVRGSGTNGLVRVLTDSWQQPGDLVGIPKPFNGFTYPETTFYSQSSSNSLWDASYIRLKSATLSYNLPSQLVSKVGLRNVRVYASGLNLLTWTSFVGFDPEVAGNTTTASFPNARQINGGIEIEF